MYKLFTRMHRNVYISDGLNYFLKLINYLSFYILIKAKYIPNFDYSTPRDSTLRICVVWPDNSIKKDQNPVLWAPGLGKGGILIQRRKHAD